jgi:hypothetical protein
MNTHVLWDIESLAQDRRGLLSNARDSTRVHYLTLIYVMAFKPKTRTKILEICLSNNYKLLTILCHSTDKYIVQ